MKIAFSPCPNDTFIFHAWVHGLMEGAPKLDVTYADIDQTNYLAESNGPFDILKISCAALPWALSHYGMLPCGGALGHGCGPLIVAKPGSERIGSGCIGIPSGRSTAFLLLQLWAQEVLGHSVPVVTMPFREIMPAVAAGSLQAGLIIHEARFTYQQHGLEVRLDLGAWWESSTQLPLPLGAIVARRNLDHAKITQWIRSSLSYAQAHREASLEYILSKASETDSEVVAAHIALYVNNFTHDLGKVGYLAMSTLLQKAMHFNLVPRVDLESLAHAALPFEKGGF